MTDSSEFKRGFDELCEAHNHFQTEALESVWMKSFAKKPAKAFRKFIDHQIKADFFPTVSQALAISKMLERGVSGAKIKTNYFQRQCDWCESGKIYFVKTYDAKSEFHGWWEFIGACAVCYPDGKEHLMAVDPRNHKALAVRPDKQGGPLIIDPNHLRRYELKAQGIDPDEMVKVDIPSINLTENREERTI